MKPCLSLELKAIGKFSPLKREVKGHHVFDVTRSLWSSLSVASCLQISVSRGSVRTLLSWEHVGLSSNTHRSSTSHTIIDMDDRETHVYWYGWARAPRATLANHLNWYLLHEPELKYWNGISIKKTLLWWTRV